MDDSAIICDEFIDVKEMNFDENKQLVKHKIFIFYLYFY